MKTKHTPKHALLVVCAALLIIGGQFYIAIPTCAVRPSACFDTSGGILAPYRYRLLTIALEPDPTQHPPISTLIRSTLTIHSAAVLLACLGLYIWLKRVSTPDRAVTGLFILAAVWMFAYHFYQRDTSIALELVFVTWALVLIDRRLFLLAALTAIATLNRETGVFILLIYAAWHFDKWRETCYRVNVGVLLVTFAVVVATIHLVMGSAGHVAGLLGTLAINIESIGDGLLVNLILLPLWIIALMAYKTLPPRFRRLLWVAALMFAALMIGGTWGENARLALVMFPLVLPAVIGTQNS